MFFFLLIVFYLVIPFDYATAGYCLSTMGIAPLEAKNGARMCDAEK